MLLGSFIHYLTNLLLQYRGIESIVAINNVVCTVYNSICSLATTTAAIVVLGDWFPAFVCSPFQLRFEEGYDSGEGLLLGLAALLDDDVDC
jgi:hypothetical protein